MSVHKKDRSALTKTLDRPMLGFRDSEKFSRTPNEIFSLVKIVMVGAFSVSQILIDDNNFCDIMYSELFEMMCLKEVCRHMKARTYKHSMT